MKKIVLALLTLLVVSLLGCQLLDRVLTPSLRESDFSLVDNPPPFPATHWERINNPENYNWSSARLKEVQDHAQSIKSDALMIIDDGRLIAAYGQADKKYYVASIRKSLLSVLYGYYAGQAISLDASLSDYDIDDKSPGLNTIEKTALVKHLLSSTSGIFHPSAASDNNDNLPARNSSTIGEKFYYNNWDFNALGTIFTQRTGRNIHEDFNSRIALPIGMQDFKWQDDGRLDFSDVSLHPAYHFDMTARDMARFGLLMMHKGKWNNIQIVPEDWITASTRSATVVGDEYGGGSYGYMWWLHDSGEIASAGFSKSAYSAQGNWSQLILVDPDKKLVIVHRAYNRSIPGEEIKELFRKILAAKNDWQVQ